MVVEEVKNVDIDDSEVSIDLGEKSKLAETKVSSADKNLAPKPVKKKSLRKIINNASVESTIPLNENNLPEDKEFESDIEDMEE